MPVRKSLAASSGFVLAVAAVAVGVVLAVRRGVPDAPFSAASGAAQIATFEARVAELAAAWESPDAPLPGPVSALMAGVRWADLEARPFLEAPSARFSLDANALLRGRILTGSGNITDASLILVKPARDAPWNYQALLEAQRPSDPAPPPAGDRAVLRNTVLRGVQVALQLPDTSYTLRDVEGELASIAVPAADPAAVAVAADRFALALKGEDPERPFLPVLARAGTIQGGDGVYRFQIESLDLEGVRLNSVAGVWDPRHGGYGITGRAGQVVADFAVARRHFPALPDTGSATFSAVLEALPGGSTRATLERFDLQGPGSRVRGSLVALLPADGGRVRAQRLDLSLEPLDLDFAEAFIDSIPFGGTLRGSVVGEMADLRLDLVADLVGGRLSEPLSARLLGGASLDGEGPLALDALDLDLEEVPLAGLGRLLPALPALSGTATGTMRLSAARPDGVLPLSGRLEIAGGVISVTGTLDASEDTLGYDLRGDVIAVPLDSVLARSVPPVTVSGTFAARGRGTDPETMDTDAAVDFTFTGWLTEAGDGLEASALVRGGRVSVRALDVALATLSGSGQGTWRFSAPAEGSLDLTADLGSVTPFRPFFPVRAFDGALGATARLSGTLDAPNVAGELRTADARLAGWNVQSGQVEYEVVLGWPLARLALNADATGLQSTSLGAFEAAAFDLDLRRPSVSAALSMDHEAGGGVQASADGTVSAGAWSARLGAFRMDLPNQRWALARPATVAWGDTISVDSLLVLQADGPGRFLVHGELSPEGNGTLAADIDSVPVEHLGRLAGSEPPFEGLLRGDVVVGGTPAEPTVTGDLSLTDARIGDLVLSALTAVLDYGTGTVGMDLDGALADGVGSFGVETALPVALSLRPLSSEVDEQAPLTADLRAEGFPLGSLAPFAPAGVTGIGGSVRADVRVEGTLEAPEARGDASATALAADVDALGRSFQDGRLAARFDGPRVEILDAAVRSDGWGRAQGTVLLSDDGGPPSLDLEITLEGIRPIAFDDLPAVASGGTLRLTGDLERPVLRGSLAIRDGTVVVPGQGPGAALEDEIAGIAEAGPITLGDLPGAASGPVGRRQLSVAGLNLAVGPDTWFVVEDARAQLRGALVVDLFPPDALRLTGDLLGERGTFTLIAGPVVRRFDVVDANIKFLGLPEPNPVLDITAARTVPVQGGGQLQVQARIGGTLDEPTLALTTETGQTIPEADLLSFLIFGQPGGAGGVPGRSALQGAFLGGLGDVFGGFLEEGVTRDLGVPLDVFQVRFGSGIGGGTFQTLAPTVVVGKEVLDNVFITADLGIGTLFDAGATQRGATWAVAVDWRIDRQWTAQAGFEPFNRRRVLQTIAGVRSLVNPRQEAFAEIRRRWTY
ncbi:MAG: translocation/assembly module TamB domain-containing protein [Gemmatimonadota bacterium]